MLGTFENGKATGNEDIPVLLSTDQTSVIKDPLILLLYIPFQPDYPEYCQFAMAKCFFLILLLAFVSVIPFPSLSHKLLERLMLGEYDTYIYVYEPIIVIVEEAVTSGNGKSEYKTVSPFSCSSCTMSFDFHGNTKFPLTTIMHPEIKIFFFFDKHLHFTISGEKSS